MMGLKEDCLRMPKRNMEFTGCNKKCKVKNVVRLFLSQQVVPLFENIQYGAKPDGKVEKGEKMVNLHLHPTVILHNLLPLDINYTVEVRIIPHRFLSRSYLTQLQALLFKTLLSRKFRSLIISSI